MKRGRCDHHTPSQPFLSYFCSPLLASPRLSTKPLASPCRPLPCGFHLGVELLRAYVLQHERQVYTTASCGSRWRNLTNASCSSTSYKPQGSSFVRHALESGGWAPNDVMHPRIMHGAARLQPLARLGAMLATSGDPAQRRHLLAKFPCHCWGHIMQYTGRNAVCKHWQPDGVSVGAYRGGAPALAAPARAGVGGRREMPEPSLSARLQSKAGGRGADGSGAGASEAGGVSCPARSYGYKSEWRPSREALHEAIEQCHGLGQDRGAASLQLAVARTAAGCFRMAVLERPDVVSFMILHLGHWEVRAPDQLVPDALPSSGALLDLGANLGWFTWMFAQSGRRVYAIEAFPQNQHALRTTLCLNPGWRRLVTVAPTAVGQPGMRGPCVVMSDRNEGKLNNAGNGMVQCGPTASCAASGGVNCEETSLTTVDEMLAQWQMPHISVVKVDVEGFECSVLAGAQTLFTTIKPRVIHAELKFPEVERCWREQAKLHGYRVGPPKGKDKNTVLTRIESISPARARLESPSLSVPKRGSESH